MDQLGGLAAALSTLLAERTRRQRHDATSFVFSALPGAPVIDEISTRRTRRWPLTRARAAIAHLRRSRRRRIVPAPIDCTPALHECR